MLQPTYHRFARQLAMERLRNVCHKSWATVVYEELPFCRGGGLPDIVQGLVTGRWDQLYASTIIRDRMYIR